MSGATKKPTFARVIARYIFLVYVAVLYMNYPRCGNRAFSASFVRKTSVAQKKKSKGIFKEGFSGNISFLTIPSHSQLIHNYESEVYGPIASCFFLDFLSSHAFANN